MTLKTACATIKRFFLADHVQDRGVARVIAELDSALIDEPLLNVLARSTACEARNRNMNHE